MKALVTGGGGFLGSAICRQLIARGDSVRSLTRSDAPALAAIGVEVLRGDIGVAETVRDAARDCDVVFHVAAKAGIWGPYVRYYQTNVIGTRNVISACRTLRVGRLVFTSSPSVVFAGRDQEGVDESVPYPTRYLAHYPETKAEAERLVLAANDALLATTALRPHLIWGPEDNHLVPRLLARARAGQLRLVGRRRPIVDSVYVENAAAAHLLAADRLVPEMAPAGRAYFISNDQPVYLDELINGILAAAELPPVTRRVPSGLALAAGAFLERTHKLLRRDGEPRMTRFLARQLATSHWFDISAAKRDLGYQPEVSIDEGLSRLAEWLRAAPQSAIEHAE